MKKIILAALLFVTGISVSYAQINFEEFDWANLSEKAAKENKLIMLDVTATWCYWCKVMEKKVFPKKDVGEFFNKNFINVKLYDTHANAAEFANKYKVEGFPAFLFLNSEGKLIHRIDGAITDSKGFISEGEKALK